MLIYELNLYHGSLVKLFYGNNHILWLNYCNKNNIALRIQFCIFGASETTLNSRFHKTPTIHKKTVAA